MKLISKIIFLDKKLLLIEDTKRNHLKTIKTQVLKKQDQYAKSIIFYTLAISNPRVKLGKQFNL